MGKKIETELEKCKREVEYYKQRSEKIFKIAGDALRLCEEIKELEEAENRIGKALMFLVIAQLVLIFFLLGGIIK
jgi:hypothetical protein